VLLVACGGSSSRASGDDDAGAPATGGGSGDGGGSNGGGFNGTTGDDAGSALQGKAVVYGHSDDTLFELDPDTKAVTAVGTFSGCTKVVDLALDKASNMFATTQTGLAKIDPATAKCSYIAKGTYPNSLSFVPAGTVDPNVEALVGYVLGDYVRIDTQSGAITTIGSLGGNLVSSGDIVSAIGGKTYLTVKGGSCSDCIVEVDPATGALVKNFGNVKHKDVFGLAFWAGKAYGFDNAGELFEMDFTASGVTTTPIAIPNASSSLSFWGAGSTTAAPLGPK
jgi:hypothetical protein